MAQDDSKRVNRRSFLWVVVGAGSAMGGAMGTVTPAFARQPGTPQGPGAFTVAPATGSTPENDDDSGSNADPARAGRGGPRTLPSGVTDSDRNAYGGKADRVYYGRGAPRVADSDAGANADQMGAGRGPPRSTPSGITDGDSGPQADRGNYGRGPRR